VAENMVQQWYFVVNLAVLLQQPDSSLLMMSRDCFGSFSNTTHSCIF